MPWTRQKLWCTTYRDGMLIVQTKCQTAYWSRTHDGWNGFDNGGKQSHIWGNQDICERKDGTAGQQSLYCSSQAEMWDYREDEL